MLRSLGTCWDSEAYVCIILFWEPWECYCCSQETLVKVTWGAPSWRTGTGLVSWFPSIFSQVRGPWPGGSLDSPIRLLVRVGPWQDGDALLRQNLTGREGTSGLLPQWHPTLKRLWTLKWHGVTYVQGFSSGAGRPFRRWVFCPSSPGGTTNLEWGQPTNTARAMHEHTCKFFQ